MMRIYMIVGMAVVAAGCRGNHGLEPGHPVTFDTESAGVTHRFRLDLPDGYRAGLSAEVAATWKRDADDPVIGVSLGFADDRDPVHRHCLDMNLDQRVLDAGRRGPVFVAACEYAGGHMTEVFGELDLGPLPGEEIHRFATCAVVFVDHTSGDGLGRPSDERRRQAEDVCASLTAL